MLSQTAEYALRAMACLATAPAGALVPTTTLAEQTQVPGNYLAKVLQQLAASGLVTGRRGVGGGYRLGRPAHEISLLEVIDTISPIRRIQSCPLGIPGHDSLCVLHRRANQAIDAVIGIFGSVRLDQLVSDSVQPHGEGNEGSKRPVEPMVVPSVPVVQAN